MSQTYDTLPNGAHIRKIIVSGGKPSFIATLHGDHYGNYTSYNAAKAALQMLGKAYAKGRHDALVADTLNAL